jgi:hypothetical protein
MRTGMLLAGFLFVALMPAGCGKSGPRLVNVSGRITMDKRALVGAWVTFRSTETTTGQPPFEASGQTDDSGIYSLKGNADSAPGVPVGAYKVHVDLIDRGTDTRGPKGQLIPEVYNHKTKLTYTVPEEGSSSANFDLSSTAK